MDNTSNEYFNSEYFENFCDYMMKNELIELTNFEKLNNFLQEDSIMLDDDSLNLLENEFKTKVEDAFEKFKPAFIKLNFAAPSDANFLIDQLKCYNLKDILTLIKGSTKLNEILSIYNRDLTNSNNKLFLIMKPWYKIDLRNEFRIFIVDSEIKGICQKHLNYFFNYSEEELEEVKEAISYFYEDKFNNFENKTFVIDILYMKKHKKIKIIDLLSEGNINLLIKSRIECLDDENEIKSYYKAIYLLYDNLDILKSLDTSINIKIIKSEAEIFDTEENLNRFPIEIIGEDSNKNVEQIIELLKKQNLNY